MGTKITIRLQDVDAALLSEAELNSLHKMLAGRQDSIDESVVQALIDRAQQQSDARISQEEAK